MARRSHVPRFGNWDANDPIPYTAVFKHARNGRGEPMINPNDPSENPEAFKMKKTNGDAAAPGRRIFNPNDPEDVDAFDQIGIQQKARTHGPPRRSAPPPYRPPSDRMESNAASYSTDQSTSHPLGSSQVKKPAMGEENNGSSHKRKPIGDEATFAPAAPTRSRVRTGDSNKDRALPEFGTWNADPNSGDGFTVIFDKARNERKAGGPVRIPQPNENTHDSDLYNQQHHVPSRHSTRKWWCCFGGHALCNCF